MELDRAHSIKQTAEDTLFSIILTSIAGIFINIGLGLMTIFSNNTNNFLGGVLFILCAVLGFIILPQTIVNHIYPSTISFPKISWLRFLFLYLLIFPFLIYLGGLEKTLFFLLIAICEEYLFRHIILKVLSKKNSIFISAIIGSLIFSIILHSNYSIIDNLLVRMPFSLIFYYASIKYKLQDAIMLHWLYNIIANII